MSVSTPASPRASRRRRFVPRFSLAAALLTITLCAIGLWYWYRVPFEVEHQIDKERREVEMVRRTWGGTVRHGPRRIYVNDKLLFVESYLDGIPHGKWEWFDEESQAYISAEFRRGRLEAFEASAECDQRLARCLAEGKIDDQRIVRSLMNRTNWEFIDTPLKDAIQIVQETHQIPFTCIGLLRANDYVRPDSDRPVRMIDMPLSCNAEGMLIEVLGIALQPHDLVCDYRYGMLWVVERNGVEDWKDPTGVSKIVPPPGSNLESQWDAPATMEFIETPLGDVFPIVEHMHGVRFDTSRAPDSIVHSSQIVVTLNVSGLPFKHCLGVLLDRIDCRASLNGETIVIELQPGHPDAQNH